jgi:hypothetical protein
MLLLVGGVIVTLAELLLSEHTEDIKQLIPVGLLIVGLPAALACTLRPGRTTVVVLRALMVMYVISGLVGVYLHFSAKMEFALEGQPDLSGWALVVEALEGSSPPILAPLAMSGLALLGLLWSYRYTLDDAR